MFGKETQQKKWKIIFSEKVVFILVDEVLYRIYLAEIQMEMSDRIPENKNKKKKKKDKRSYIVGHVTEDYYHFYFCYFFMYYYHCCIQGVKKTCGKLNG